MKCLVCSNKSNFKPLSPFFCQAKNYLCNKCGLVFIPQRNSSIGQYYKRDGYFKKSPNIACRKRFISESLLVDEAMKRIESALEILHVPLKGKEVLDVGCGYGEILYWLKRKYQSRVTGIEASSEASQYGSKIFSIPIYTALLEEFKSKGKSDVIWCSHVLEHTSDPDAFLKKIRNLLKVRGYLYVEVPNILRPSGGFNLDMFLYNEHLQTFSVYNLYLILKKNGFRVVGYTDSYFLKFWCRLSNKPGLKPLIITPAQVLGFLQKYKDEYKLLSSIKVYAQKMIYATKLACYKVYNLLGQGRLSKQTGDIF